MKIASYNVENLFDLNYDGTEYSEYIPNTVWKWNSTTYRKKLINLSKVIKDIDPDIIVLQEIESDIALKDLQSMLARQGLHLRHRAIADKKNTSVRVAILSRFPLQTRELAVSQSRAYRNILEVKVIIENKPLYIFTNHWKSKSGPESKRIQYAKTLKKRLDQLPKGADYILAGDFNADYQEHIRFVKKRKHNDTKGITGINHILKTVDEEGKLYTKKSLSKEGNYNLWMDLPASERWTHTYRGKKEALDHIIISPALANIKNSHYVEGSFKAFSPEYLMHRKKPFRWQRSRTRPLHHTGKGYSDHLPIVAEFFIQ